METAKQRRRTEGNMSSTTCKQQEKPAITQGSLVAGESERIENTKTNKRANQQNIDELHDSLFSNGTGISLNGKDGLPLPTVQEFSPELHGIGTDFQKMASQVLKLEPALKPFVKLKLQLFPIDEGTRKGLEEDKHNPHLELTLRARKKISSVLKHLNNKWGNSSVASGDLMLFPYDIQKENIASYRRWTIKDIQTSAADVYAIIGSPIIFRLRYGWFSNLEPRAYHVSSTSLRPDDCSQSKDIQNGWTDTRTVDREQQPCQEYKPVPFDDSSNPIMGKLIPLDKEVEAEDNLIIGNGTALPSGVWADGLTNISIGDLLMEVSQTVDANRCDPMAIESDTFDGAIAAFKFQHQGSGFCTTVPGSSIWDAEETCHAFPFQMIASSSGEVPSSSGKAAIGASTQNDSSNSARLPLQVEAGNPVGVTQEHASQEIVPPDLQPHTQGLDNVASWMTDIHWGDSLGPFDLGISSSRQLIGGDSISLSSLIATSLDAFENCSFFSSDRKVPR
ncbi:TSL-kinase interacting protein 1-like [Tasmannia lanceolata]|uniref:TSL-kinase interacting protein 1-like n=1 Tax=Tasmannia lanceolata TaxID=3420 RepID=UPI0040645EDD